MAIWPAGDPASEKADDFITDLWVWPLEFQGRGIGTALLEAIEAGIRRARLYAAARLDTHARNIRRHPALQTPGVPREDPISSATRNALDEDIDKVEMIKEFEPGAASKEAGPEEDGLYGI
jgi:ribosomal-protein-alanine N-acetyltransferase